MKTAIAITIGILAAAGIILLAVAFTTPGQKPKPISDQAWRRAELRQLKNHPPEAQAESKPDFTTLQFIAERMVKQNLKAPSTAKFPGMFEQSAYELRKTKSGTYIMKGWVDAQNSFGAMIRSDWYVEFRQSGDSFEPVRCEIAAP